MTDDRVERLTAVAALAEPTRRRLYDHVVRQPDPVGRDEAAAAVGVPRATAAFHLDRLADDGLLDVVRQRRTGRSGPGAGHPAKLYRRGRAAAGAAGSDALLAVLEEHGFEPRADGDAVVLVNCPFHALAQRHRQLVCGMNVRLVEGVLAGAGETGLAARLA